MTCKEIKQLIEDNKLIDPFIIFVCKDNKFLNNGYICVIMKFIMKFIANILPLLCGVVMFISCSKEPRLVF